VDDTSLDVFINCPFDKTYKNLFEATLFTIAVCGYRARCALEEDDSGDIRFGKLCRLIAESPRSIHDLSRTEVGDNELPRFNMPFELGLTLGAKQFGGAKFGSKTALIMVREPNRLPAYLSDLGGNDPKAHHGEVGRLIAIVRRYLGSRSNAAPLPGQKSLVDRFEQFKSDLPRIAATRQIKGHEIDALQNYRDYAWFLAEFLKANPAL
jgi:hypothetical protein